MLHVHCGDSSADSLRESGLEGEIIVWADLLTDGPVRDGVDETVFRRDRAAFLAEATGGGLSVDDCLARLTRQDRQLAAFADHDEVVLWFDGCLYDQTILMRHLAWFAERDRGSTVVSLICIGEFPDVPDYAGLGEMTPAQLAAQLGTRRPVTSAEFEFATAAWAAYRSPDPTRIEKVLAGGNSPLPYLAEALRRHLQQYPSVRNGLNRLENQVIEVVAAGDSRPGTIFRRTSRREERPFFGDTRLWKTINDLASAPMSALSIDGPGPLPLWDPPRDMNPWTISTTPFGASLADGSVDWVEANGVDRWLGGVHLNGTRSAWRWDERRGCLVASP